MLKILTLLLSVTASTQSACTPDVLQQEYQLYQFKVHIHFV